VVEFLGYRPGVGKSANQDFQSLAYPHLQFHMNLVALF